MKKSLTALAIITVITLISACSHTKQGETPYQTSTVEDKKNDDSKNNTASYTLTAPRATFKEDGSAIKGGTFKGDVYVECNNFKLIDATIDGNVYFKDKAAQDSFQLDDSSKVTGKMEIQ